MRRFVGYIALVFTIIVAVVFNVTLQTSELNTGLEYGTGYEAVYRVDFEESTKSFEDIVDIPFVLYPVVLLITAISVVKSSI